MTRVLATVLAIGGLAWLVKVGLIIGNGGTNTDEGVVAACFFVGAFGILVGSTSIGLYLMRRRGAIVRGIAAVLSVVATFVLFGVFEGVLTPIFESSLPKWGEEEVEIVALAVYALIVGLAVRRGSRESRGAVSAEPAAALTS